MKGLMSRFQLVDGAFKLTDGAEKSRDNIWFFCVFDKFRVYTSDYGGSFLSLMQKPISYLVLNRTLIVSSLKKKIAKYVSGVKVEDIDIGYTSMDRKNYHMKITYSSKNTDGKIITDVTFI